MPHFTVEYSANLDGRVDIGGLLKTVQAAALETGLFPIGGLRVRAARRDQYEIGDGHPDNAFVYILVRIGAGRTAEDKRRAGEHIFAAVTEALQGVYDTTPLSIGMDIEEIEPGFGFKKNNLHDIIRQRSGNIEG